MEDQGKRLEAGKRAGRIGIGANVLLFFGKLAVGTLSGSLSVTADAMNNLSDAASSVVTLLGFRLAQKPADEDHPYGHARYEYLSALAVAVLILFIGYELAKSSIDKILSPTPVRLDWITVAVLVASMAVKLGLAVYDRRLGKRIGSEALIATATDCRNDVIATGAVLLSMVIGHFFRVQIDGPMGLGVAVFIILSGLGLARETVSTLLGGAASPELREQILDQIRAEPKVLGYHDLMVHDYGPGRRFASVHVEMDHREDPLACHEIIDALERECWDSHGIHLVIHYDPVVTDDPEQDRLRGAVRELLTGIDPRLTIHDFRTVSSGPRTELVFDIAAPADRMDRQEQIRRELAQALPEYGLRITFDLEQEGGEDRKGS